MNTSVWVAIGVIVVVLLLCLCTCCVAGAAWFYFSNNNTPTPFPFPTLDLPTAEPTTPAPPVTTGPLPPEAEETLKALAAAVIPDGDLHELAIRFKGVPADTPRVASTTNPDYPVGTRRLFHVSNVDTDEQFDITAILVYKTPHLYMWVQEGVKVNEEALKKAADLFEQVTYPTDREFFGSEWTPGVDGDPHLSILHARNLGSTVAGYFSSPDSYVKAVREDSNEMEMFYVNLDNQIPNDDYYNGVLAHEFQHMIHFNNDRNEDTWLNEGCSELAVALNAEKKSGAYDVGGVWDYLWQPDLQLTTWSEGTAGSNSGHYAASYLFVHYFLDRFGEEATKALVANEQNGMESVDLVLQRLPQAPATHKELFADWTVANLLDDPKLAEGQYGYRTITVDTPETSDSYTEDDYPVMQTLRSVNQYGVDYIELQGTTPLQLTFQGSTQVGLLDTQAHSGQYLWWSNRADESDSRLTRMVDLRQAQKAQVSFWLWYSIEEDWDYGYVVVGSTASGRLPADLSSPEIQWRILNDNGLKCTTTNPNNNSFGCGFTGTSGGWKQRTADLSAYAGKEIALRFEYITDAAVNQPGLALDDIEITVDGQPLLTDDVEAGAEDWIAEGFVRHANVLPQEWIVQLVTFGPQPRVERLLLADQTAGEWTIPLSAQTDRAVLIISALAPITTQPASYEFNLTPAP